MAKPNWIGETIGGRYQIEKLLGQGGMSAVYQATDPNLRRVVAVKLIHTHLSDDPSFVRRFEEEATTVAQLRHPNIIQIYDFNHDGDTYYIVFEFIPGETLHDRMKRLQAVGRRMDLNEVLSIATSVADALDYAHSRNLVHRDVKPANVMLNVHNQAILMDFGIVKIMGGTQHTATGATIGTARYMSPEQIRSANIDGRTDIYSLGVMLYEMLAGRAPFEADSAMTTMMMHVTDPVPDLRQFRPDLPAGLLAVVNRALAKDPNQRYRTAGEFVAALRAVDLSAPAVAAAVAPITAAATVIEPVPTAPPPARPTPAARPPQATAAPPPAAAQSTPQAVPQSGPQPALAPAGKRKVPFLAIGIGGAALIVLFICVIGAWALGSNLLGGGGDENATATSVAEATAAAATAVEATAVAEATSVAGAGPAQTATAAAGVPPTATATNAAAPATATTRPTQPPPTATAYAATATATGPAPATNQPPTATNVPPPTATLVPPPTETPPAGLSVQILNITLNGSTYVVNYETYGYVEQLPGTHIHFFFNTVPPEQAGMPGSGPWILYGGPRPFQGYSVNDRPAGATMMCALVANPDHSVIQGSGNCMALP
ncbi:MAG: serine/threonine protein kinase [Ardenticatenaceae bacterium]|nr:serine/threonine protein kinase [Ardenticatenaceae bacterium]